MIHSQGIRISNEEYLKDKEIVFEKEKIQKDKEI